MKVVKITMCTLFLCFAILGPMTMLITPAVVQAQEPTPCDGSGHQISPPGDNNADCVLNLVDVVRLIHFLFTDPGEIFAATADINCDHTINAVDLAILVDICFRHAVPPSPCGGD